MSPTLWAGIIAIVILLELVRIGMTTYVLLHLLESCALRRHGEGEGQARRSLRAAPNRARREVLLDPTLTALRTAMDEVAAGRSAAGVDAAVAALDRYALALAGDEHR